MSNVVEGRAHRAPDKVPWIEVTSTGQSNVTLAWLEPINGGEPIRGYRLLRWDPSNELTSINITETSFVDEGLDREGTYTYQVLAYNDVGDGESSDAVTVTISPDKVALDNPIIFLTPICLLIIPVIVIVIVIIRRK